MKFRIGEIITWSEDAKKLSARWRLGPNNPDEIGIILAAFYGSYNTYDNTLSRVDVRTSHPLIEEMIGEYEI